MNYMTIVGKLAELSAIDSSRKQTIRLEDVVSLFGRLLEGEQVGIFICDKETSNYITDRLHEKEYGRGCLSDKKDERHNL